MATTFKLTNMTAQYEGGKYTLTPSPGYVLKNRQTGALSPKVVTRDYTRYEPVPAGEAPAPKKTTKKTKKA